MTIGDRIKARREQLNLSQGELAAKLGYKSRSSINKIELGMQNLTQSKIKAIADALDTTPAYIMGWEDEKEVPVSLILTDEEQLLIYCWRQATPEIRENVAFALRYYGMPKPQGKKEDGLSISHGA